MSEIPVRYLLETPREKKMSTPVNTHNILCANFKWNGENILSQLRISKNKTRSNNNFDLVFLILTKYNAVCYNLKQDSHLDII